MHKTRENERKKYFRPAAHAHSGDRFANVPGSSLFVHKDVIAYSKTLAGCTDVSASLELHHLHMPYLNCPDFSKLSAFAYPHRSGHEDMPLEQQLSYLLSEYVWVFTNRTRQIWWWILSDSRDAESFGSLLFVQLYFSRIPNANYVADIDIHRHTHFLYITIWRQFLLCQNRASLKQVRSIYQCA